MKKKIIMILIFFLVFFINIYSLKANDVPNYSFNNNIRECSEILGANLVKVVHAGINTLKIVVALIAIVKGMMVLIPAIISKDSDELKKSSRTLVLMSIILVVTFLLPSFIRIIGGLFEYDVSCIF